MTVGPRHAVMAGMLFACSGAWDAQAADLGDITVHSWLGRQLKASIALMGDDARESEARCFTGSLVNLNNEVVGTLKLTLQHSAKGAVLLLFGGNAVDEPAAMVRVVNACGQGAVREYALLLDQAPEGQVAAAVPAVDVALKTVERAVERPRRQQEVAIGQARKEAPPVVQADIVSAVTGMMRLSAMLRPPLAGGDSAMKLTDAIENTYRPVLKLAQTLGNARTGDATSTNRTGVIAGMLSLLAIVGAAGWIMLRVREMKATSKPWVPVDAESDAGTDTAQPVTAVQ